MILRHYELLTKSKFDRNVKTWVVVIEYNKSVSSWPFCRDGIFTTSSLLFYNHTIISIFSANNNFILIFNGIFLLILILEFGLISLFNYVFCFSFFLVCLDIWTTFVYITGTSMLRLEVEKHYWGGKCL